MTEFDKIVNQAIKNVAPKIIERLNFYLQINMVLAPEGTTGRNPRKGEGTLRIITGRLLKSFQLNNKDTLTEFEVDNGELTLFYGTKLEYGYKNEKGINVPARPFFDPAIEAFEADGLKETLEDILKEIQKLMK